MSAILLGLAATPALAGSLWILDRAAAPPSLLWQQSIVATFALLATWFSARFVKASYRSPPSAALLMALAALLLTPMLTHVQAAPQRWLGLAGLRLYLAPVVVPIFLLLWHRALEHRGRAAGASGFAAALVGAALFAQPDAAQLTAFGLAAVPLVWRSTLARAFKLALIAGTLLAAAFCWSQPDPLDPVPYVEGVFQLAASASPAALWMAVVAAALPVAALLWLARQMRSAGLLAVAVYFGTLLALAPTQSTPVPLLGFGAGPIIGYFLMVSQSWRRRSEEV